MVAFYGGGEAFSTEGIGDIDYSTFTTQQDIDIARMNREAEAQQARNLEYYENWKAQEVAYYEATGDTTTGYDVVAETILDTHDYLKGGTEYVIEETLDLPEDILIAAGDAGATIVEASAVPLAALETPLTGLGLGLAAVAAVVLLRKK